ncbi:MAG TPA: 30S ribosomal protein S6 [Solirubrobacterales bacterium]
MAAPREYELVLMLDPGRDAPARDSLAKEAKGMIESGGTLKHENDWGLRKMAYEIDRRNEADYRWFRFEASAEVLEKLDHNLKIADGVLRFRIFKVDPEAPVMVPPTGAAPAPGRDRDRGDGGRGDRDRGDRPAPQQDAAPAEAPAETPAEAPTEAPAETPAEAPAEAAAETPAEAPAEAAAESSTESPDETSVADSTE